MDNRCVCCGEIIPEGRQICYKCEKEVNTDGQNDIILLRGRDTCFDGNDGACDGKDTD